mmetsp:Transcript_39112/g.89893  ORF Transcript_39112/g.89893 Transcript_39112/m.89893 type:complete len:90 (-) Transcript_39112:934-1203(-)
MPVKDSRKANACLREKHMRIFHTISTSPSSSCIYAHTKGRASRQLQTNRKFSQYFLSGYECILQQYACTPSDSWSGHCHVLPKLTRSAR